LVKRGKTISYINLPYVVNVQTNEWKHLRLLSLTSCFRALLAMGAAACAKRVGGRVDSLPAALGAARDGDPTAAVPKIQSAQLVMHSDEQVFSPIGGRPVPPVGSCEYSFALMRMS
jgi:hypothetical protein